MHCRRRLHLEKIKKKSVCTQREERSGPGAEGPSFLIAMSPKRDQRVVGLTSVSIYSVELVENRNWSKRHKCPWRRKSHSFPVYLIFLQAVRRPYILGQLAIFSLLPGPPGLLPSPILRRRGCHLHVFRCQTSLEERER